jgi:hypothetical protein
MDVGMKVVVEPIPPILENTEMFDAGAVRFGVEYRLLNNDIVDAQFGERIKKQIGDRPPSLIDDRGVSIHVFGGSDSHEYLRFDCFDEGPHYHYVYPHGDHQTIVAMDRVANGDPLTWTLGCLRERLAPMLRAAGGETVADAVDAAKVRAALDKVESAARSVVS